MDKQLPFFSVIIPLYNKANFIEACLRSVLNQKFTNFEIIVVNDGSTDESLHVAKRIEDDRIQLVSQKNKGAAAARNYGVDLANSKWIAFLDADDYWKKNHLSNMYSAIENFPNQLVFTCRLSRQFPNNKVILAEYNFKMLHTTLLLPYFANSVKSDLLNTSGVVVNKEFFNQIGRFNERIYSGQDTDLFIRIGLATDIVFIPKSSFVYNQNSENNISITPRFKERLMLLDKYEENAKENYHLKKYLDLNRFSIYMRSKMNGDSTWKLAKQKLNKKNLGCKQLLIINLPRNSLLTLKKIQHFLFELGIKKSAF